VSGDKVIVAEVMIPNEIIRRTILNGDIFQLNNILYTSREPGIRSLDLALQESVQQGLITQKEAAAYAMNPELFM